MEAFVTSHHDIQFVRCDGVHHTGVPQVGNSGRLGTIVTQDG